MSSFKDKHIVITGASSGIGQALAVEFAKLGSQVSICARNQEKLRETCALVEAEGAQCHPFIADVSQQSDCEGFIASSIENFGAIHVLINNAGVSMRALFEDVEISVLREIMDINFWGTVYCTKAALPSVLETHGTLVAISSVTGFKGLPGRTAYAASKFALHGFYESLRMEHHKRDLHVMISCPGWTSTNIRRGALTASGSKQEKSPRDELSMDTPEKVALEIIQGIRDRKKLLINSRLGRRIYRLNKYFPNYVERRIYKEMSSETDSPIK